MFLFRSCCIFLNVNSEYHDGTDLEKLMHDFNCMDTDNMNYELMAERTRYLKENPKAVFEWIKLFEQSVDWNALSEYFS